MIETIADSALINICETLVKTNNDFSSCLAVAVNALRDIKSYTRNVL